MVRLWMFFGLTLLSSAALAAPLNSTITYQGSLEVAGQPAQGEFDFNFELFDAPDGVVSVGTPVSLDNVTVDAGIFSVQLDFGTTAFAGDQLWVAVSVRNGGATGNYTNLLPRQPLTAVPYALHAEMVAAGAVGSAEIASGSVGSGQINSAQVQRRIAASCPVGSSIRVIALDGAVSCETDDSGSSFFSVGDTGAIEPDRSVRVQPGTAFPMVVRHPSALNDPQLALMDSTDSGFARLSFYNDQQSFVNPASPDMWTVAASITPNAETDRMNFFNRRFGDVMSLTGDGLVGINTSSPLAAMDLRSNGQWRWDIGNGRGDFYLGDGAVGLSIGLALGGAGRGTTRIWTSGGEEQLFFGSANQGDVLAIRDSGVGIGNINPGAALDVTGQVRVRDFAHGDGFNRELEVEPNGDLVLGKPASRTIRIGAMEFQPAEQNDPFERIFGLYYPRAEAAVAPIELPDGAQLLSMTAWLFDQSSSANLTAALASRRLTSADIDLSVVASVNTSGSANEIQVLSTTAFSAATVDDDNTYWLQLECLSCTGALAVVAVEVVYQ
ncbi:MAG: hypothetical protein AB8B96_19875 [Lysobacterales bacterium]